MEDKMAAAEFKASGV